MSRWPVLVFDDDGYPYVLSSQQDLSAWAEGPETADEFVAAFDSVGRSLLLVFEVGGPSLISRGEQDDATLRWLVKKAATAHGKRLNLSRPAREIDSMTAREVIEMVCADIS